MGVSPRPWACHQDFVIISGIRAVVLDDLVILNDWHLNQNQKKNTANYTNAQGNPLIAQRMKDYLHQLRCSNNETKFLTRRAILKNCISRDPHRHDSILRCINSTQIWLCSASTAPPVNLGLSFRALAIPCQQSRHISV